MPKIKIFIFILFFNSLISDAFTKEVFIKKKKINNDLIEFLIKKNVKYINTKFSIKYFIDDNVYYQKIGNSDLFIKNKEDLKFIFFKNKNLKNDIKKNCYKITKLGNKEEIFYKIVKKKFLSNSILVILEQDLNQSFPYNTLIFDKSLLKNIRTLNIKFPENRKLFTFDNAVKTDKQLELTFDNKLKGKIKFFLHFDIDHKQFFDLNKNINIKYQEINYKINNECSVLDFLNYNYYLKKTKKIFTPRIDPNDSEILNLFFKFHPIIYASEKNFLKFVKINKNNLLHSFLVKTEIINSSNIKKNNFSEYFFSFDGIYLNEKIYKDYFEKFEKNKNIHILNLIILFLIIFIVCYETNYKLKFIDLIYFPLISVFVLFLNIYFSLILILILLIPFNKSKQILFGKNLNLNYLIMPLAVTILYFWIVYPICIYFFILLVINFFRNYLNE